MSRIVTALFKDRAQARQALQSLLEVGIVQSRITTVGLDYDREVSSISGFRTLDIPDESKAALRSLHLPEADMRLFEQGLSRGCCLVAARVDRDDHEDAVRILEMFNPVDLDQESREWASEAPSPKGAADTGGPLGAGITGGNAEGQSNTAAAPGMGNLVQDGSSLGTADLRTGDSGSTVPTGQYTDGRREDLPGVNEQRQPPPSPQRTPDTGMLQREMNRRGPVWTYGTD